MDVLELRTRLPKYLDLTKRVLQMDALWQSILCVTLTETAEEQIVSRPNCVLLPRAHLSNDIVVD